MRNTRPEYSNTKYRDKDYLYTEYVLNNKSSEQIAKDLYTSGTVISYWMKKFNISLRSKIKRDEIHKEKTQKGHYKVEKEEMELRQIKREQTNLKKYGVKNVSQHLEIIKKINKKNKPKQKLVKYKNVLMRSSWEIKYAKYLDNNNIKWEYENKQFFLKSMNCYYIPDFNINNNEYVEIKGRWYENSKEKYETFKKEYPHIKIKLLMKKELKKLGVL